MENSTEVKVESVKAINPTAIEVTFNNAPKELTTKDIKVGDLDVKKVELDGKKAIVTVSGAKYDTAYDVVYGDQKNTVKFGKVAEYFTLKIESDAKDTNNNSIPDIEASGATTTQLTAYIVDYKGDVVTDYDGKFEFLTTNGSLAQTEVVIQKGKASVQLRSVSSLETIYADVTAKVVTGNELSGLVGNTTIEFAPKQETGEAQTAVPVVKAQTETADRVQVVLGQPKKLTEKELLAVKGAAKVMDTVLKREVDVKEVRQINDTILELVLDTYSQKVEGTYDADNYLTDNAEHTVSFTPVKKVLVETATPLKFKLTDGTKQVALGATGVNQRTIEVRFNDPVAVKGNSAIPGADTWNALNPANYVLDGKALKDSKIDLKRDEKGNIVGEGRIVEIKLSQAESIKKEQTVLQVRNVGDWAAVTDVKNQIATQDLFLTTNIDQTKPAMVAKTESPEQFRLVFNQPVKASDTDLKKLIDVRYGEALTKEEAEKATTVGTHYNAVKPAEGDLTNLLSKDALTNTGVKGFAPVDTQLMAFSALKVDPKTGIRTVVKTNELDADAIIEEILVELTDDWTEILGAEAYWTAAPQIQFKVKRNAFATAMDNKNIAFDVVADNSVYDTKSPVATAKQNKHDVTEDGTDKVIGQAYNEYLDITFDEPVQISELKKQGTNVPNTPNAKQDATTQKTDVEFSKNGVVVKGAIYAPEVGDTQFKLTALAETTQYNKDIAPTFAPNGGKDGVAALKAAIEKKNTESKLTGDKKLSAAGTWTVKVTGVSDDYGNTMAAQTFNFEVPGEAVAPKVPLAIDPFVVYANFKKEADNDVITVKYSEVMANAGADGVGLVTNYWVNSGQLTADAGAQITKGIDGVTEDWDGVTITLPEGTVQKEDFMLTVASNLKSADGQTLTRDNKLNLVKVTGVTGKSSYVPGLLFVNEFDKNAYDALGTDKTTPKLSDAALNAQVTSGKIGGVQVDESTGLVQALSGQIEFSHADAAEAVTTKLQLEVNGIVVDAKAVVSGSTVTYTVSGEDFEKLELEEGKQVEVKVNGQTVYTTALTSGMEAPLTVKVTGKASFDAAMKSGVSKITLTEDITTTADKPLVIDRSVDVDFNSKAVTNVKIEGDDVEKVKLEKAKITGELVVNAPNGHVEVVSGTVAKATIKDVAGNSFVVGKDAEITTLEISDTNGATVTINGTVETVNVTEGVKGLVLDIDPADKENQPTVVIAPEAEVTDSTGKKVESTLEGEDGEDPEVTDPETETFTATGAILTVVEEIKSKDAKAATATINDVKFDAVTPGVAGNGISIKIEQGKATSSENPVETSVAVDDKTVTITLGATWNTAEGETEGKSVPTEVTAQALVTLINKEDSPVKDLIEASVADGKKGTKVEVTTDVVKLQGGSAQGEATAGSKTLAITFSEAVKLEDEGDFQLTLEGGKTETVAEGDVSVTAEGNVVTIKLAADSTIDADSVITAIKGVTVEGKKLKIENLTVTKATK